MGVQGIKSTAYIIVDEEGTREEDAAVGPVMQTVKDRYGAEIP